MGRGLYAFPIMVAILALSATAMANPDVSQVEIHGYGGWTYSKCNSQDNRYLTATKAGDADYVNMAFVFTSRTSDRVWINAQVWWERLTDDEWDAVVDYAFGEWRVSDALRLRMGQVKQPYGIYTEIFDVGTLRPFFWLPQGIYGPSGAVAESYRGIGLTGSVFSDGGWRLEYDLYGGEFNLEAAPFASILAAATETAPAEDESPPEDEVEINDVVGGRVTVTLPESNIRLGFSAYTGRQTEYGGTRHFSLGAHAEYLDDTWTLRSECSLLQESPAVEATAAYLEIARRLSDTWQIAGRVDYSKTRLDGLDAGTATSLLDHRDLTVGLNHWFDANFVAKLSGSWVDGNRFAHPEDLETVAAGTPLDRKTRLVSLGVQFAF